MIDAPPPIVRIDAPAPGIVERIPGVVRCGGEFVQPLRLERPFAALTPLPRGGDPPLQRPVTLAFDIDTSGRPVSIRTEGSPVPIVMTHGSAGDLQPSLAASRFPAAPKVNCLISYTPRLTPMGEADPSLLAEFLAPPWNRNGEHRGSERLSPEGATCRASPPTPRTIDYPRLDKVSLPAGSWAYAAVLHDISSDGVPENLRILAGSGHPEVEAEALRSISASRFAPEAKSGCVALIGWPSRQTLEAPPMPESEAMGEEEEECEGLLAEIPEVQFPPDFRKRSIEGWAIIRYSVAPWGEIGSVEIVEAQPAAAFGESARRLMVRAKGRESETGRSGCLQRVRFQMSDSREGPRVRFQSSD